MLGKGKKKLDFNNYKGLKPTKINHKEGEEQYYGYGYTGKYLNNGEAIDYANNHGQLPNFRTHKPVQLQPSDLGYQHYRGSKYQPANYGPQSQDEWNYGTTDPNFKYGGHAYETLVLKQADSFFGDLKPPSPPPQNVQPSQPRRGKIPFLFGFFKESSEEETQHAEKLMEYQNKRRGKVKLQSIVAPVSEFEHLEKGYALYGKVRLAYLSNQTFVSDDCSCIGEFFLCDGIYQLRLLFRCLGKLRHQLCPVFCANIHVESQLAIFKSFRFLIRSSCPLN